MEPPKTNANQDQQTGLSGVNVNDLMLSSANTQTENQGNDLTEAKLGKLEQELGALRGKLTDPDYMQYLAEKSARANQPPPQIGGINMPDFEEMPQRDIVKFVLGAVEAGQKAALDQVGTEMNQMKRIIGKFAMEQDVGKAKTQYGDFDNLQDSTSEIMKKTPGLTVEQAYKIAKYDYAQKQANLNKSNANNQPPQNTTPPVDNIPAGTTGSIPQDDKAEFERQWSELVGKATTLDHLPLTEPNKESAS